MRTILAGGVIISLLLTACGGGGANSDTSTTPTNTTSSSSSSSVATGSLLSGGISRYIVASTPISVAVNLQLSSVPSGTLTAMVSDGTGTFSSAATLISTGADTYTVQLGTSSGLAVGEYSGSLTIKLCYDQGCTSSAQPFSAVAVPFDIKVLSSTSTWGGNNLSTLSAWSGVSDWTTFQGNAAHTGFVPVSLNPDRFSPRWQRATGTSTPVTTDDGRFFAASGYILSAFSEDDGSVLWNYDVSSLTFPSVNPPAVGNGAVYMAAGQQSTTYFMAFDEFAGTPLFKSRMTSQWEQYLAPTIGAKGVYTNAGSYGGMYAFSTTGDQLFFNALENGMNSLWTPALDSVYAYAYSNGILYAIDQSTGVTFHAIKDPSYDTYTSSLGGAPVVGDNGYVFAANYGNGNSHAPNSLIAFNIGNDSIAWSATGSYPTTPAASNGLLYAANNNPVRLEARSEADGTLLWSWVPPLAGDTMFASEVLATNNLIFISTNLATYVIDMTSHKTVWSYPLTGKLALSKNGILYIKGSSALTAINLK